MLNFADTTASAAHPFVGLRPFRHEDSAFFFGREEQIDSLERLMALGRMVAVVGSSGSGKSSLIRAGLLPRLSGRDRQTLWDWVEMRPGEAPVRNLAEALARPNRTAGMDMHDPLAEARADRFEMVLQQSSFGIGEVLAQRRGGQGRRMLILVDQFEEIFRFADLRLQRNRDARQAAAQRDEATFFVQLLLSAVADEELPACIVITMRSDFIGECARFNGLSEAVTETQYLVPALTRDQRATAIRGPVKLAGGICDPAVVQRLLNDSNEDPDQLPVMQHAAMRCWQHASLSAASASPHMTLDTYKAIGGFEGALTQHGDELLASLVAHAGPLPAVDLGEVAKRVFQSLTEIDSQGRIIRRPQTLADLVAVVAPDDDPAQRPAMEAAVRRVVLHFADPACSFLRAPEESELLASSIIDIGHEALIRRWVTLGGLDNTECWVKSEQNDADEYRRLLMYTKDDLIPRGPLLTFEAWWAERRPTRFWARRYTPGGEDRLQTAAKLLETSRRKVRSDKQRQWVTIIAGLVLLVALVGEFIYSQQQFIERQQTERLAALKQADDALKARARSVAVEGVDLLRHRSASDALLLAIYGLEPESHLPVVQENEALAYAALEQLHERTIIQVGSCGTAPSVAFMPDGTLMTYNGVALEFWDAKTGLPAPNKEKIGKIGLPFAFSLQSSPNGSFILISSSSSNTDRTMLVNPITTDVRDLDPKQPQVGYGVLSPNGTTIVTASSRVSPKLWRVEPGEADDAFPKITLVADLAKKEQPIQTATAAAISDKRRVVALGGVTSVDDPIKDLGRIAIYDLDSGNWVADLPAPAPADASASAQIQPLVSVSNLVFDPSGERLLATYANAPAQLWSIAPSPAQGSPSQPMKFQNSPKSGFSRAVFSRNGRYVSMTSGDQRVRIWDTQPSQQDSELPVSATEQGSGGPIYFIAADGPRQLHATGSGFGDVRVWGVAGALSRDLQNDEPVPAVPSEVGGTAIRLANDAARYVATIESTIPGVPSGKLTIPTAYEGFVPQTASVSTDGLWGILVPKQGPLLVYDLHRPDNPVAALGSTTEQWSGAAFLGNPDRIIGLRGQKRPMSWRFFPNRSELLTFAKNALPLTSDKRVELSGEVKDKLDGQFWPALSRQKEEVNTVACTGQRSNPVARSTTNARR